MKRDFLCVSAINTICRLFVLQLKIVQQQTKFINIERIAFCFVQRCKKKSISTHSSICIYRIGKYKWVSVIYRILTV